MFIMSPKHSFPLYKVDIIIVIVKCRKRAPPPLERAGVRPGNNARHSFPFVCFFNFTA